ncbi:MAG: prolyl oligopeptidase family serine peptidase [Nocardioidaceae bacterium]|nr:prolyl oligopeptidase family serine peptidase [Nocardioidaceae bacterium]
MSADLLPDAVLRYDDHGDGILDVHLPANPSGTGVLLVHGGFWKTAYDRTHTRPMARALADAGFVVATPEYRRVGPGGSAGSGGGGWPGTGADVRGAATALPDLLAGIGVRLDRLRATGHSAGGHLVLWLATTDVSLDRVVALAPVCDLREAIRLGLGSDAARAFLGDADPDAADPMLLLDERPATDVRVVHGVEDDTVPVGLSRGLVARHPWIGLTEVPGGHYELIEPDSTQWATVMRALSD